MKLKVAFISPHALQDTSSGAALTTLTMLTSLAQRGIDCHALTMTCFDSPPPGGLAATMADWNLQITGQIMPAKLPLWGAVSAGISHTLMQSSTAKRTDLRAVEESLFMNLVRSWLDQQKPDMVLTFGGLLLDGAIRRLARQKGAAVVFYLANSNYSGGDSFEDVDRIITNSSEIAQLYAQRLGLQAHNVGVYVDPDKVVAAAREPRYVTYVNPSPGKGVALFLRLVMMARERAPDMRFLVVESRAALASAIEHFGLEAGLMEAVTVLPRQSDMREVYKLTRSVLVPSFCFEAAGRVLIEAMLNGIPVLASNRGGIPETLGDGGTLLDVPQRCHTDFGQMPTEAEAQAWWDALYALHCDDAHYQVMCERATAGARMQSLEAKAAHLEALLLETVRQCREGRA